MNERKTYGKLLKRVLIVCLCLVMALGTTVTIMAASFNGDLDGDGKVTAFDAQLLAEYQEGSRDLDPATVIGLTIRGILDRVLGKIVDEPVEDESAVIKTVEVQTNENGYVTEALTFTEGNVTVTVPVDVKVISSELVVTVTEMDASAGGVTPEEGQELLPLDIHVEGVAEDNTVPVIISVAAALDAGMNLGNVTVYHVENDALVAMTQVMDVAELTAHNSFYYDPATGDVTVAMATFSEVSFLSETAKGWEGGVDHSWYNADAEVLTIANADQLWSFSQIVGGMAKDNEGNAIAQDSFEGKVVNLAVDIDLGDKVDPNVDYSEDDRVFYPIGYYNSEGTYVKSDVAITSGFYSFRGTFDGQGHTIANFYHNTWEMKGDHNWYDATLQYYRDGMGLFGKVYGGTVKNLTVENFSSDGEIATTGTIAAYADCGATFENISIFNCNPRVYNIGNGGIVGCVGWYANDEHTVPVTFKNITVDNTNKISALWGSWDVACGGLVGQYYPTSGQSNAIDNAGIHMENCHVAAQIDVNNDVCANYQYYAYRYAGILIGSIRENETIDGREYPKMDGITASDCTVHFGDWNDYYYCELVANSLASYTHDHQMSRLTQVAAVDVENKTVTYLNSTTAVAIPASGTYNYVVVNGEHATENATCYHFVNGEQHLHEDEGTETVDGETVLVEDKQHLYLEFNNLCTGYGWGVTSKGVEDLEGVTILDRTVADSVDKFELADGVENLTIENGIPVRLGDLFAEVEDNKVSVFVPALNVSVTDLNELDGVNTTVELIKTGDSWQDYQVIFHGVDNVEVTIQDYYYCAPTRINLAVSAHVHCLCGETTELNAICGSCDKKATIWEPTAEMPANSAEGHYYLLNTVQKTTVPKYSGNVAICLNGCDVISVGETENRCMELLSGSNVSVSDCAAEAGKISGSKVAAIRVYEGATFNLYNGIITDNHNLTRPGSGIVYLNVGNETDGIARFNMYGGEISGNTMNMRGAVFTQIPESESQLPGEIHILGGKITGNISHAKRALPLYDPMNGVSGGAGIYSFGPVYVGGDAYISGNECTLATSSMNPDIQLRTADENSLYSGKIIVEKALSQNAYVNYGAFMKDNSDDLQSVEVDPSLISENVVDGVLYEGNTIYYDAETEGGRFYTEHIHCLCGNDTVADGVVCAACGSDAVEWSGISSMPAESATGYYYLQQDITRSANINTRGDVHFCLNGHNVNVGDKQWNVWAETTISDCMAVTSDSGAYRAGQITGLMNAAGIKISYTASSKTSGILKLYDGMITGNNSTAGTVWLGASESDAETTTKFYMYGGKISGNTVQRGAVFTQIPTTTLTKAGEIYILGGAITGNTGTNSGDGTGGGAGIYAFGPVYVGGDAKVIDNTGKATTLSPNIVLRNDSTSYQGQMIVSSDVPLTTGAQIDCSTYVAEANTADLQYISGEPEKWVVGWIKYNNDYVHYVNGTFSQGVNHCLCGQTTTGTTCESCNTEVVGWTAWTETDSLPTTTGNYYLTSDVYVSYAEGATQATVIGSNQKVAIDLCGNNIIGDNNRLFYIYTNATLSITDTTANVGVITGFTNQGVNEPIMLHGGATLNLYNGIITENTSAGDGIIEVGQNCHLNVYGGEISNNNADKNVVYLSQGTLFNMYGGKIANNTVHNSIVILANAYVDTDGNKLPGATFNMYGGEISGNKVTNYLSGTTLGGGIRVMNEAAFAMSGGEISNNNVFRGTVIGEEESTISILGGTITDNIGNATRAMAGGTGIYSFGPVTVGGTAQIHSNTALGHNPDIWLRNAAEYAGKLIISTEVPLERGAKINFGTGIAAADAAGEAMGYIEFADANAAYIIQDAGIFYNGNQVCYGNIAAEGEAEQMVFYYVENSGEGDAEVQPETTEPATSEPVA